MTTTLITGGNRGLGYEVARRLIDAGQTVWIGARDASGGQQAADRLGAHFVQLDVTEDASVEAAVASIEVQVGHLDVLINNAGILGEVAAPEDMTADQLREVYETNVFGLVRVTHAFLPLLRKGTPWYTVGRKPLPQQESPPLGPLIPELKTTKAGRSRDSFPRPYTTHAPMLGLPNCMLPVFMSNWPGAWLNASVVIPLIMAMSSTMLAVYGRSSEISAPDFPCFANLNFGPISFEFGLMNAARYPFSKSAGGSDPSNFASCGL